MNRVMVVYRTGPEVTKAAPLMMALPAPGQHREVLDQVNDLFGIESDRGRAPQSLVAANEQLFNMGVRPPTPRPGS